jgi:toxin ParE1/3/4
VTVLRVLPEAEQELAEAAVWYEGKRAGLGVELIAVLDRAFEDIVRSPLAYPAWRKDRPYRKITVARFPYVVFFQIDADAVEVIAVAHAKRRPGYWVQRVRAPPR